MSQTILRWFGIVYLAIGLAGFVFHDDAWNEFGVLNVNALHTTIHAAVGAISIILSLRPAWTRVWGWIGILLFAPLVVFGFAPGLNPLATAIPVPLTGNVVWFHIASLLAFVAIVLTAFRVARPSARAYPSTAADAPGER